MIRRFIDQFRGGYQDGDSEDFVPVPPSDTDIPLDETPENEPPPEPTTPRPMPPPDISATQTGTVIPPGLDDTGYRQRSETVERIESIFSGFGAKVCAYILTQALMPGGVRRLVMKLELSSRGRDGADLAQIAHWIEHHGVEVFCQKVGIRIGDDDSDRGHAASQTGANKMTVPRSMRPAKEAGGSGRHTREVIVKPINLSDPNSSPENKSPSTAPVPLPPGTPPPQESDSPKQQPPRPSKAFPFSPRSTARRADT